ncbi:MAG: homocitrate synthase [Chloroflexi bacterium]|uniref:Homocitrate synthase n=1 Tax=Candidatus Chlorohelix allophototropha TaxID=3003348 RepID=A0A8T7M8G9_9CHLR|nr:homocitrate synthase [Chloroflexota bacterium]WJW68343.1 homocitrate synthase [Chloroflexota bacterium L227-S17]
MEDTEPQNAAANGITPRRTNIKSVEILDTTLREGEQFSRAHFSFPQKIEIATALARFGVDYIEVGSPVSYPNALEELTTMVSQLKKRNSNSKVLVHCRVNQEDVDMALETGAYGINLFMGTSKFLQKASHGKSVEEVSKLACNMVEYVHSKGRFARFGAEDAFRTDLKDLLYICAALDEAGVDQVDFPDTVGGATPFEVYDRILEFTKRFRFKVEFHGHNDTGCGVANALAAMEAGAHCINVTVMGIGERNGICSLSGLVSRLYSLDRELVKQYNLVELPKLDKMVATILGVPIPHDMPITAPNAFTHKAGIHTKAILQDSQAYEVLRPEDFGIRRTLDIASRITGKHAIAARVRELELELEDADIAIITEKVRHAAGLEPISLENVDLIIKSHKPSSAGKED